MHLSIVELYNIFIVYVDQGVKGSWHAKVGRRCCAQKEEVEKHLSILDLAQNVVDCCFLGEEGYPTAFRPPRGETWASHCQISCHLRASSICNTTPHGKRLVGKPWSCIEPKLCMVIASVMAVTLIYCTASSCHVWRM